MPHARTGWFTLITIAASWAMTLICYVRASHAENSACWGDETRTDISCVAITEKLMLGFRGLSPSEVRMRMKASGRGDESKLHFLSNYSRGKRDGSGDVNVEFENGRATSIYGFSDDPTGKSKSVIWSAYSAPRIGDEIERSTLDYRRPALCSDFGPKTPKCSASNDMEVELSKVQMQGNLTRAQLLSALNVACNPGQNLIASEPNGECDRIRRLLR